MNATTSYIIREKLIISFLVILILFFSLFTIAFIGIKSGTPVFNLGIGVYFENWMIIVLSMFFIVKMIYELVNI